ncbi:complement factor H-related protein 5-like [Brachionichthys hirsutus]|uniref:complement factor H-related protein 5-like n=1 Tax=Brachionichthys hirsutus TaxID=412623 RepID=UPI003604571E
MCTRHLGFLLLIWLPEALHARNPPCATPTLYGGVFAPQKESYRHGMTLVYNCADGHKAALDGWWGIVRCQNGRWSHTPRCTPSLCGSKPVVANGDVVAAGHRYIMYQCNIYYKMMGPEAVACHGDGTWTNIPTCKEDFCTLDTNAKPQLEDVGVSYLRNGEIGIYKCLSAGSHSRGRCVDGHISLSSCCPFGFSLVSVRLKLCSMFS